MKIARTAANTRIPVKAIWLTDTLTRPPRIRSPSDAANDAVINFPRLKSCVRTHRVTRILARADMSSFLPSNRLIMTSKVKAADEASMRKITIMNSSSSRALSGPASPWRSLATLPQIISNSRLADASEIAGLFLSSIPVDPTSATTAVTRIDCSCTAEEGMLRMINGERMA